MPTLGRKVGVLAGWVSNLVSRRDIIGIPQQGDPREAFQLAAGPKKG
jgi:NADH dehydrogenase